MLKYLILLGTLIGPSFSDVFSKVYCEPGTEDIYSYSSTLLDESAVISYDSFRGKVVLIYNTATYWGITIDSYSQINTLAALYDSAEFVILGYPCTQFGKEEPGDGYDEIMNGITYVRPGGGFIPSLTLFVKSEVNGEDEIPIYTYLKGNCPLVDTTFRDNLFYSPLRVGDVHWNFEKFLIGRDGFPYSRYHPDTTNATDLIPDINYLLSLPPA